METTTPTRQRKIDVTPTVYRAIRNDFKVSHTTVDLSLKFALNSPKGQAIREKAMDMMAEVVRNNEALMED